MNASSCYKIVLGVAAVVLAAVPPGPVEPTPAAHAAPVGLTDAQVAALPAVVQAQYLAPLRTTAVALDAAGKAGAQTFSQITIDPEHHEVDLYVTAPAQAASIIRAAKRVHPSMDASLIRIRQARYTIQQLDAARVAYLSHAYAFEAYAIGPAPDGSGLDVEVANPALSAQQTGGVEAGVAIVFEHGARRVAKVYDSLGRPPAGRATSGQPVSPAWAAVKWHDSTPFIGGDVITPDGHRYCTAGLPAVRTRDHHPIMVTAAHCFSIGQNVFTGGGPTWSWNNNRTGNFVGRVTGRIQTWDAETLDGANNNADDSENAGWKPMTSAAYSYVGDFVCQSGARSAYLGHGTPCGIKVTNQDLWFSIDGYSTRGVEGVDVNGWGSVNGDSGGTVFARTAGTDDRQARGMVSAGGADGTPDQARVDWPEAPDILRAYGLALNPTT